MTVAGQTITDEKLAEMLAVTEHVPNGEWTVEGSEIISSRRYTIATVDRHSRAAEPIKAHLLNCHPDTIAALLTELQHRRANEEMDLWPDDHAPIADKAVDHVFKDLAKALGLETWNPQDGSETWEGDVYATMMRILTDAGVIDEMTGKRPDQHRREAEAGTREVGWFIRHDPGCEWQFTNYNPERMPNVRGWESRRAYIATDEALAASPSSPLSGVRVKALDDVAAERQRQMDAEGWTPEHDDEHSNGEMARAAAAYAVEGLTLHPPSAFGSTRRSLADWLWPWDWKWWKPKDRRHDLVRAAALLVAEIERLDRLSTLGEHP